MLARLSLGVAAFGVLALLASGAASSAWQAALLVSSRNTATDIIYVWTVRSELLVLAALLAGVALLSAAARKTRGEGLLAESDPSARPTPMAARKTRGEGLHSEPDARATPAAMAARNPRGPGLPFAWSPRGGSRPAAMAGRTNLVAPARLASQQAEKPLAASLASGWLWLGAPLVVLAAVAGWRFGTFNGGLLLGCSAGALWVGRGLSGLGGRGVWWLLGTALVLRMATAVGLGMYAQSINGGPIVLDDEQSYDFAARQVARILGAGVGDIDTEWRHLIGHHLDLVGLLYWLREPNFTSIRLVDAAFGTLAVALVLGIGLRVWGSQRAAYGAAWLTALWPLLVLWTATGLRESLTLMAALLLPWLAVASPWRGQSPELAILRLVVGLLAATVLLVERPEAFGALALAALLVGPVALLVRRASAWPVAARLALVVAGIGLLAGGVVVGSRGSIGAIGQPLSPRSLEYRAAVAELTPMIEHIHERLPPKPAPDMMNLGTLLRAVPPGRSRLETAIVAGYTSDPLGYQVLVADGMSFVILPQDAQRPTDENVGWQDVFGRFAEGTRLLLLPVTPWDSGPSRRVLLAPDALAWDVLLLLSLVALRREWPRIAVSPIRGLLFAYPWLVVLGLALTSTNVGTVARHRSTLVPWLVLASAPLLLAVWERARHGLRPASVPAALKPVTRSAEGGSASGVAR